MIRIFRTLFHVVAAAAVSAAALAEPSAGFLARDPDTTRLLNGDWSFKHLPAPDPENEAKFFDPSFSVADWKTIPVPSNWAVLGYEEPVYRGFKDDKASEGLYRREFTVPGDWKDKRVLLHFDGVWSSAEVWLNGTRLGRHDSGYSGFAFELGGRLKPGESNLLAVRVRQVTPEYKFDVYDDWTMGGIYRDVWLEAMPKDRWLDNVTVETDFDEQFRDAELKIRAMVGDRHESKLPGNYPLPGEPYDLRFTLTDSDGKAVGRKQLTIPGHTQTDRETSVALPVSAPRPWNAEAPYLYNLRVDLLENGEVTHTRTERVGFREISTRGGVFRINGQAVKLRGVNRHDEHPDVGRATTPAHWKQDIELMKAANINYIRAAHYPHAEGFVELCDEMGMYVGDEISVGGAGELMHDPSFASATFQRVYETVERDINRPSVIYWSVGNEDALTSQHLAAVKTVKALDPTRPVLLPWRAEEWLPPEIDILAPHYWKPQEYDALAKNSTRPIISTEYTHAYGTDGLGGLESRWKALTHHPSGAGAAIWLWADQGIKTPVPKAKGNKDDRARGNTHLRITGEGWDGIVDSYRNPTRDYWEAKSVYSPVQPAADRIEFKPGQAPVRVPIHNGYDFTDLGTVTIAWSLREDGRELATGSGKINAAPHAIAEFELPLEKLKTVQPGKTYYAWFVFNDPSGAEIARKAVELVPQTSPEAGSPAKPTVIASGDTVTIEAGEARYVFDPKTGQLVSASRKETPLIADLRPVLTRKLDQSETFLSDARNVRSLDLTRATPVAKEWTVEEKDGVRITAKVEYTADPKNRFTVSYRYTVRGDGELGVHYEILTQVDAPWVPIVGMALKSAPGLDQLHWLGLGPYDAYPNKRSAPILGLWGGAVGSEDVTGIKATRWIERTGSAGGLRIASTGYLQTDAATPDTMFILSGVLGRPEKSRKADESVPQLETNKEPFTGGFTIELTGAKP